MRFLRNAIFKCRIRTIYEIEPLSQRVRFDKLPKVGTATDLKASTAAAQSADDVP